MPRKKRLEDLDLLKKLCSTFAPAGEEGKMTQFILSHVRKHSKTWKHSPTVLQGGELRNNVILVFGQPRTALFAHMDSIGFTVRYNNELVKLGGPRLNSHIQLVGKDKNGPISTELMIRENKAPMVRFKRDIEPGTNLCYKANFRETRESVQCCYMDNRLGVYVALKTAERLKNGVIVFSTWEETGGGSVKHLARKIYEDYQIMQALICDITWVTEGVHAGKGAAISMRDSGIPRRAYVDRIMTLAEESGIPFQREVESSGGSDGNQIQASDIPIDWCFIGAPEINVHTPDEKVHKDDIRSMLALYEMLMEKL